MDDFDWIDRDRGILTKRDRRYLRGDLDDELNDNEHYQKRYQIRQRIRNAMYDFHILYRALPARDINLLWDETDYWISRAQGRRQRGDAPPYPEVPLLGQCWRDLIAFFTYAQITTGIPEAENLVKWVIEEGVNMAVRRSSLENYNMYQEMDSTLDWGTGETYRLTDYLHYIGQKLPADQNEAEDYLLDLQQNEYLLDHHVTYLYQTYVED